MKTDFLTEFQPEIRQKYENLLRILRSLGKTAVAYSGGVDSTFLLVAASEAPVDDLIALTMKQPYFADWELEEAIEFAKDLNVQHKVIEIPVTEEMRTNPHDRCYKCKSFTFKAFWDEMKVLGYDTLLDGTISDDIGEYRPGLRAVREQNVRSPLKEAGFTKEEIRAICREKGLPVWDKPSNTCLITRIPYNTPVTSEDFRQIEYAEHFLIKAGFGTVRVRKHNDIARIEVEPNKISKLVEPDFMQKVVDYFKGLGFKFVTIDMSGYKTGSLDADILKKNNSK
jgi:pyridinium-3,5-biscarboxylic acid mononucleotide sulfurtransferase